MIELSVATKWRGMVAIRDKFLLQALIDKSGIRISHNNRYMTLPYSELEAKIVKVGNYKEADHYGRKQSHLLIYFDWSPND